MPLANSSKANNFMSEQEIEVKNPFEPIIKQSASFQNMTTEKKSNSRQFLDTTDEILKNNVHLQRAHRPISRASSINSFLEPPPIPHQKKWKFDPIYRNQSASTVNMYQVPRPANNLFADTE